MKKCIFSKKLMFLLCIVATFLLPLNVFAANQGSIHVRFQHENTPISGAVFNAYRVSDMSDDGEYTITKSFSEYPIFWDDFMKDKDEGQLAVTLSSFVSRDNISADAVSQTDANGDAYFNELQPGVYLVIGETVTVNKDMYFVQPAMVNVPTWTNGTEAEYNVTIEPKYEHRVLADDITRKALKIWKNDSKENRPSEITVQLLKNGKVYDEKVLNEKNNWRYTWDELDPAYNWQILEKDVPDGYKVSTNQDGITYTITNTYENPSADNAKQKTDSKLPKTGMLWWPVAVMLAIGMALCVAGVVLRKRTSESNE